MINTQTIYDRLAIEFGVRGNSDRFEQTFFSALTSVCSDLASRSFLEVEVPDSMEANIDIESKYYGAMYKGLLFYINNAQEWNVTPKGDTQGDYELSLRRAQSMTLDDLAPSTYFESDED